MNKKTILIIVCVVLIAGSVFMLYRTFFSTPSASAGISSAGGDGISQAGGKDILPYGDKLDFTTIDEYNSDRKKFPYPQVSTGEIGITPPQQLIK